MLGRARTSGVSLGEGKRDVGKHPAPALWNAKEESRRNSLDLLFPGNRRAQLINRAAEAAHPTSIVPNLAKFFLPIVLTGGFPFFFLNSILRNVWFVPAP